MRRASLTFHKWRRKRARAYRQLDDSVALAASEFVAHSTVCIIQYQPRRVYATCARCCYIESGTRECACSAADAECVVVSAASTATRDLRRSATLADPLLGSSASLVCLLARRTPRSRALRREPRARSVGTPVATRAPGARTPPRYSPGSSQMKYNILSMTSCHCLQETIERVVFARLAEARAIHRREP